VKRRLFSSSLSLRAVGNLLAAALSLVLCLATVVLWVRSYWVWDTVAHATNWHPDPADNTQVFYLSFVMHANGIITFESFQDRTPDTPPYQMFPGCSYARSTMRPPLPTTRIWNRLGFSLVHQESVWSLTRAWHKTFWNVPYWLPALLTFLVAGSLSRRAFSHRRAARIAAGLCPRCGYDLRASKDRCPECGTAIGATRLRSSRPAAARAGCRLLSVVELSGRIQSRTNRNPQLTQMAQIEFLARFVVGAPKFPKMRQYLIANPCLNA
jgi:hypothetical protein